MNDSCYKTTIQTEENRNGMKRKMEKKEMFFYNPIEPQTSFKEGSV